MSTHKHVLLSVVMVVDHWIDQVPAVVNRTAADLARLVTDYELILVDNGSDAGSSEVYRALTSQAGEPNVQVYRLLRQVDRDLAAWVGVENSLGDLVLVHDPFDDTLEPLGLALDRLYAEQADLVVIVNDASRPESAAARHARRLFHPVFRLVSGVNLRTNGSAYRLMSKRLVSHLLQHPITAGQYRTAPTATGFAQLVLRYHAARMRHPAASMAANARRAMALLLRGSFGYSRLVARAALALSALNIAAAVWGSGAAAVLSAGTTLLLALLGVLIAEYLFGHAGGVAGPAALVAEEWSSAVLTRRERLDVDWHAPVAQQPVHQGAGQ